MNRTIFLLTIFTFSATFVCKSMEKTHQFKELKTVENPFFAQYITHDRAVIASEYECCIINPITDEIIKEVITGSLGSCHRNTHCTVHPNKKKFALAYQNIQHPNHYELAIYGTKTGEKEWSITEIVPIQISIFSPINPTIFINYGRQTIECDYITNKEYKIDPNYNHLHNSIALHPTQNNVCVGIDIGNASLYSLDESRDFIINRQKIKCSARHYQYNHDGSIIIAYGGHEKDIKIITPLKEYNPCSNEINRHIAEEGCLPNYCGTCGIRMENATGFPHESIVKSMFYDNDAYIKKATFYLQSSILAMLQILWNKKEQKWSYFVVKYANIQTQKYMYTSPKLSFKYDRSSDVFYDLSFSPHATQLLITCNGKSIIMPVPWEINKLCYFYLLLKHYK